MVARTLLTYKKLIGAPCRGVVDPEVEFGRSRAQLVQRFQSSLQHAGNRHVIAWCGKSWYCKCCGVAARMAGDGFR
eukprot:14272602-Alexandrium_andersonii.AAC.1